MGPQQLPAGAGARSRTNGPGGIRTRDLFSAIEARSHCATGPLLLGSGIVPERLMPVKESTPQENSLLHIDPPARHIMSNYLDFDP